jgi:hypothetical protein
LIRVASVSSPVAGKIFAVEKRGWENESIPLFCVFILETLMAIAI